MSTGVADVFIAESFLPQDGDPNLSEGRIIQRILTLSGKAPEYVEFGTTEQLKATLAVFSASAYRYLHVSCHGHLESRTVTFTNQTISVGEFAEVLHPFLKDRRLFLSACEVTTDALVTDLMPSSGCYSVIGPRGNIKVHDATIMWASLYHCLFAEEWDAIKRQALRGNASRIAALFHVPLTLFLHSAGKGFKRVELESRRR